MPFPIQIPRLGWSMEEGNFSGWLKKDGEQVSSGQPLFTLEGEKAAQDIEATESGILRIPKDGPRPGDVVKVGQTIGHLLQADEANGSSDGQAPAGHGVEISSHPPQGPIPPTAAVPVDSRRSPHPSTPVKESGFPVSPRARRRAAQLGLDTRTLRGRGPTGRITEADILQAAQSRSPSSTLSPMRRAIAQKTAQSFSSIPHYYLRSEIDVTALIELRMDLLPKIEAERGVRLTLTDLILRAQGLALQRVPLANAIWVNDDIRQLSTGDVGLVVALPDGLQIPIVRSPGLGSLADLVEQRSRHVRSARSGQLSLQELEGGATTLSNLGHSRVDEFAAVIAPPHATMLAVGRAALRPLVHDGKIEARTTLKLCLSVDHRVLDGAPAAGFLDAICEFLENPAPLAEDSPQPPNPARR